MDLPPSATPCVAGCFPAGLPAHRPRFDDRLGPLLSPRTCDHLNPKACSVAVGVDGFIAGPDQPLDWVFRYAGPNQEATGPSGRPAPCWAAGEATSWTAGRAGTKRSEWALCRPV